MKQGYLTYLVTRLNESLDDRSSFDIYDIIKVEESFLNPDENVIITIKNGIYPDVIEIPASFLDLERQYIDKNTPVSGEMFTLTLVDTYNNKGEYKINF